MVVKIFYKSSNKKTISDISSRKLARHLISLHNLLSFDDEKISDTKKEYHSLIARAAKKSKYSSISKILIENILGIHCELDAPNIEIRHNSIGELKSYLKGLVKNNKIKYKPYIQKPFYKILFEDKQELLICLDDSKRPNIVWYDSAKDIVPPNDFLSNLKIEPVLYTYWDLIRSHMKLVCDKSKYYFFFSPDVSGSSDFLHYSKLYEFETYEEMVEELESLNENDPTIGNIIIRMAKGEFLDPKIQNSTDNINRGLYFFG